MSNKRTILLVGDVVDDSPYPGERPVFDEDNPSRSDVAHLTSWIQEAGYTVDVCDSVSSFVISTYKDVLVFPLWRGGASRNRTAIVPAQCEERGLPFVGGDAYVQALCQDKSLSKLVASASGIAVPREIVLRSENDLRSFLPSSQIRRPFVVKPLYSACSIGIDDSSLCHDDDVARCKAESLFAAGLGPVVCEEFIEGEEISLCFVEEHGVLVSQCVGVYQGSDGRSPFYSRLFTFADKTCATPTWRVSSLPNRVADGVWALAESLTRKLGKVDLMRIDGRLTENGFVLIELTPDIHMGLDSMFLGSFSASGYPPTAVLDGVIRSSLSNHAAQRP